MRANQYQLPEEADVTIVIAKDGRVLQTLLSNLKQIDLSLVDNDLEQLLQ